MPPYETSFRYVTRSPQAILLYPPTRTLTPEEKDLVWTFRYYLTRHPAGLTKFVKSVVWSDAQEAQQATEELLPKWAEPQLSDALELLGPSFQHLAVRTYAVRQLAKAKDDELILYLLQLVQALKFDDVAWRESDDLQRAAYASADAPPRLLSLLCERGVQNNVLGTLLFWYLNVERHDARHGELYEQAIHDLKAVLHARHSSLENELAQQQHFVELLSQRCTDVLTSRESRPRKIDRLRTQLADRRSGLRLFQPALSLPLDPSTRITGVVPENSTIFKSNLLPLRLEFRTEEPADSTYTMIVKKGDDLRQDQLILQLFALMDRLLRAENLNLKITPYSVLATGPLEGLVQYVPSKSVAAAVAEHGDLLSYMRAHYPDEDQPATFHVQASVLDTFVRSCGMYFTSPQPATASSRTC